MEKVGATTLSLINDQKIFESEFAFLRVLTNIITSIRRQRQNVRTLRYILCSDISFVLLALPYV